MKRVLTEEERKERKREAYRRWWGKMRDEEPEKLRKKAREKRRRYYDKLKAENPERFREMEKMHSIKWRAQNPERAREHQMALNAKARAKKHSELCVKVFFQSSALVSENNPPEMAQPNNRNE